MLLALTEHGHGRDEAYRIVQRNALATWDEGGTLEEPGTAGEYEFTYTTDVTDVTEPFAVSYQPSLTHRAGCEVRFSDEAEVLNPDNPYFDFVPAGGEVTTKKIVDTATCNDCHGRLAIHGDGRFATDYCQACHNPYTRDQDYAELLDLGHLAHAIHAAVAIVSITFMWSVFTFGLKVILPQGEIFSAW